MKGIKPSLRPCRTKRLHFGENPVRIYHRHSTRSAKRQSGLRRTMDEKQHRFLSLSGQLPARLTVEQVAWMLNCPPHSIAALLAAGLLKPLGDPPTNGIKFFCTAEVQELIKDRSWLAKVTNAIIQYTRELNVRKLDRPAKGSRRADQPVIVLSTATAENLSVKSSAPSVSR